ncbi:MAG: hypothetical protein ACRD29_18925 [Acidimicrobiales bacterium]
MSLSMAADREAVSVKPGTTESFQIVIRNAGAVGDEGDMDACDGLVDGTDSPYDRYG